MCNVTKYWEKLSELREITESLSGQWVLNVLQHPLKLYAAYAAAHDKNMAEIDQWYEHAEGAVLPSPEAWAQKLMPDMPSDQVILAAIEVGMLYESAGYWFLRP